MRKYIYYIRDSSCFGDCVINLTCSKLKLPMKIITRKCKDDAGKKYWDIGKHKNPENSSWALNKSKASWPNRTRYLLELGSLKRTTYFVITIVLSVKDTVVITIRIVIVLRYRLVL